MQTSEGTLLKNGSKLGKIMVAQPLPPLFKTDQSLGKTALRAFTWIQQSFLVKNFKNIILITDCQEMDILKESNKRCTLLNFPLVKKARNKVSCLL